MNVLYATDFHGRIPFFDLLQAQVLERKPEILLIGGDLFPRGLGIITHFGYPHDEFIPAFFIPWCEALRRDLGIRYPRIYAILGNDDPGYADSQMMTRPDLWSYCHNRVCHEHDWDIAGYNIIPPSPFLHKDWERYDVSRYADPGCIHPQEGYRSRVLPEHYDQETILDDLQRLGKQLRSHKTMLLFHCPPYETNLDHAALDGKTFEYVPLDVHIGSIAIRRFLEEKEPQIGLFGHVHESSRITGMMHQFVGSTLCINPARDNDEFVITAFNTDQPAESLEFIVF